MSAKAESRQVRAKILNFLDRFYALSAMTNTHLQAQLLHKKQDRWRE